MLRIQTFLGLPIQWEGFQCEHMQMHLQYQSMFWYNLVSRTIRLLKLFSWIFTILENDKLISPHEICCQFVPLHSISSFYLKTLSETSCVLQLSLLPSERSPWPLAFSNDSKYVLDNPEIEDKAEFILEMFNLYIYKDLVLYAHYCTLNNCLPLIIKYSQTCLKRPSQGRPESGLWMQAVLFHRYFVL